MISAVVGEAVIFVLLAVNKSLKQLFQCCILEL